MFPNKKGILSDGVRGAHFFFPISKEIMNTLWMISSNKFQVMLKISLQFT
jgi:hypothetical protein